MKKVVGGKVYDTETADRLGKWQHMFDTYALYRTKKGAYFGVTSSSEVLMADDVLQPLSEDEAFEWLVKNGGDALAVELFPNKVEEA